MTYGQRFLRLQSQLFSNSIMDILSQVTWKAANFFAGFLSSSVEKQKRRQFVLCLKKLFVSRFENHWYPNSPTRGQAYRCIRINSHSKELIINEALVGAGLTKDLITLPLELTVWIDPNEVSYRIGEDEGSICPLFTVPKDILFPTKTFQTEYSDDMAMNPLATDFIPQTENQSLAEQPGSQPLDLSVAALVPHTTDHTPSRKRRYRSKKSKMLDIALPYPVGKIPISGYIQRH